MKPTSLVGEPDLDLHFDGSGYFFWDADLRRKVYRVVVSNGGSFAVFILGRIVGDSICPVVLDRSGKLGKRSECGGREGGEGVGDSDDGSADQRGVSATCLVPGESPLRCRCGGAAHRDDG